MAPEAMAAVAMAPEAMAAVAMAPEAMAADAEPGDQLPANNTWRTAALSCMARPVVEPSSFQAGT